MSSLKEIKGRISSVKSTLKITSAMKMVASAKLHQAQTAIENMLPYEESLHSILTSLQSTGVKQKTGSFEVNESAPVAIIALASNSSLCGGFNSNVIKECRLRIQELRKEGKDVVVYSVGKKMTESMRKLGLESPADYSHLSASPSYDGAAALAQAVIEGFEQGKYSKVELIYNHFVSTSTQKVLCETYLPFTLDLKSDNEASVSADFIVEPSPEELLGLLMPRVQKLKIYTVLLDSAAAEHAARTVAMQTATDNGENILQELTLEYNKGRQQKITAEILDLVGGMQES